MSIKDGIWIFCCRKLNNMKESEENTKHTFKNLPNDYSLSCLQILDRFGLLDEIENDDDSNVNKFQINIDYFIL